MLLIKLVTAGVFDACFYYLYQKPLSK